MPKSRRKQGHVRLTCPHCGRNVTVQRPQRFQAAMPCPNCRVPISATLIAAAAEATRSTTAGQQSEEPRPQTDSGAEESSA